MDINSTSSISLLGMELLVLKQILPDETLPLRQAVLRPNLPLSESRFQSDQSEHAAHYGVFDGEMLVAVGTVYPEACEHVHAIPSMAAPGAWRLRGMATANSHRNRGCGELILRACLEHAKRAGGRLVWAHARTGAVNFYLRHGLIKVGNEYELPKIGPHYLMMVEFK